MIHLFTASDALLSKAIRKATGDPVSHYAQFYPKVLNGVVLHSDLIGVRLVFASKFLAHAKVLYEKRIETSAIEEEDAIKEIEKNVGDLGYDFKALLYQGYCVERTKYFGTPMPTVNAWENRSALLCTELYDASPERIVRTLPHLENLAMIRPYQLAVGIGAVPLVPIVPV